MSDSAWASSETGTDGAGRRQPGLLAQLSESGLQKLLEHGERRVIAAGRLAFEGAGSGDRGGILTQGLVRVYLVAADGRELTLRYAREESLMGFVPDIEKGVRIRAITDAEIIAFPWNVLMQLMAMDSALAQALVIESERRLAAIVELLSSRAFDSVDRRIAKELLRLTVVNRSAALPSRIHITQQALADDVGTRREVVNRILGRLKQQGIVDVRRDGIVVSDLAALQAMAAN